MSNGRNFFLDTAVFIRVLAGRSQASRKLILLGKGLYTNEYCMMELRRYIEENYALPAHLVNEKIDSVRGGVKTLSTPQVSQYQKLAVPDKLKSDKPIIQGAIDVNAVLVTYDRLLLKEAKKFVEAKTPEELWRAGLFKKT